MFANLTSAFGDDYVSGITENVLQILTHLILLTTQWVVPYCVHFTNDRLRHNAGWTLPPKITRAVSNGIGNWNSGGLAQVCDNYPGSPCTLAKEGEHMHVALNSRGLPLTLIC